MGNPTQADVENVSMTSSTSTSSFPIMKINSIPSPLVKLATPAHQQQDSRGHRYLLACSIILNVIFAGSLIIVSAFILAHRHPLLPSCPGQFATAPPSASAPSSTNPPQWNATSHPPLSSSSSFPRSERRGAALKHTCLSGITFAEIAAITNNFGPRTYPGWSCETVSAAGLLKYDPAEIYELAVLPSF